MCTAENEPFKFAKFSQHLETLEQAQVAGRDLAECLMMLVPEPWQQDKNMAEWKRSFYEYPGCRCSITNIRTFTLALRRAKVS